MPLDKDRAAADAVTRVKADPTFGIPAEWDDIKMRTFIKHIAGALYDEMKINGVIETALQSNDVKVTVSGVEYSGTVTNVNATGSIT